jgi:hypothetical protein
VRLRENIGGGQLASIQLDKGENSMHAVEIRHGQLKVMHTEKENADDYFWDYYWIS